MHRLLPAASVGLVVLAALAGCVDPPVELGTASSFALLAGHGLANSGPSTVVGDVGTHPGLARSGFGTVALGGVDLGGGAATQQALADAGAASADINSRSPAFPVVADLGGFTLGPGVYRSAGPGAIPMTLNGELILDAGGNASDSFLFSAAGGLFIGAGATVVLRNGASACNVHWQVEGPAHLGAAATFAGTLIASDSISLGNASRLEGRAVARDGTVSLENATVAIPDDCTAEVPFFPGPPAVVLGGFGAFVGVALVFLHPRIRGRRAR